MLHNRSRLAPNGTQPASATITEYEVLRGAFLDACGQIRHGKLNLLGQQAVLASSADPVPVLLTTGDGVILDVLGGAFPALAILRVPTPPLHPVSAATCPTPRYDTLEIKTFAILRSLLRRAIRNRDASLLGHVATVSARIRQRRLPQPRFDALLNVAVSFGACGLSVPYAGSGAALIFDPEKHDVYWSMQRAARALRELGICRASRSTYSSTAASSRIV